MACTKSYVLRARNGIRNKIEQRRHTAGNPLPVSLGVETFARDFSQLSRGLE